jgi:hypothetical protein
MTACAPMYAGGVFVDSSQEKTKTARTLECSSFGHWWIGICGWSASYEEQIILFKTNIDCQILHTSSYELKNLFQLLVLPWEHFFCAVG